MLMPKGASGFRKELENLSNGNENIGFDFVSPSGLGLVLVAFSSKHWLHF
jgi:hypothetical protein